MLTALAIKNYALIEDIRVDFGEGLTIITGETGAGKSILLGALALLLGKRADLGSVRDPEKKCIIEGHFLVADYGLEEVFGKNDLDYDPHTIIRREILPSGKSRAFVNDTPVALAQLQALAPHLIDVHSQHETLEVVSENFQMEVIDAVAGNFDLLELYRTQREAFREISDKLDSFRRQRENALKELDYNTFLHQELREANLRKLDQQQLEESYEMLNNAEAIKEALLQVYQSMESEERGILYSAKEARQVLGRIRSFSKAYDSLWERLNSTIIEMEDISNEIGHLADTVDADPELLLQVNESLQTIHKLQQKHGVSTIAELVAIEDELGEKVNTTLGYDKQIENLEEQQTRQRQLTLETSQRLHRQRKEAIPLLKEKLEEILAPLGLPNARFRFELTASEDFKSNGTDSLQLLFTANKGLAFGMLKKVASGGELSRIMLAIKAVLADYKKLPTIVFDEIDTGVSGEIANKMALILKQMSKSRQLLSITHLPQIAARGDHHFKVYKQDVDQVTSTHLSLLGEQERLVEIAQMLGGKKVSEAAMANARELLD